MAERTALAHGQGSICVVIPAGLLRKFNIHRKDRLEVLSTETEIILRKVVDK